MEQMVFCYCCRVFHDKAQMRAFQTRVGRRWRCLQSIEAAARPTAERDAFGRQQSEINRQREQCSSLFAAHWRLERLRP